MLQQSTAINLPSLSTPLKVLFTGYLVVVSVGLMVAGMQIMMTHGMADGKFGLSVDDVVYSYYGNRENSKLEVKLAGSMKDKADTHDRATIVKWVRQGSPEAEYHSTIKPIVDKNCVSCHGGITGLPSFVTFEGLKAEAKIDEGATISSLTRVSHIHLFGISFIFFFICLIFSLSIGISPTLKSIAIGTPFAFLLLDIMSWWATKWYPGFAYLEITGGLAYNLAAAYMILTSLYQMWLLPRKRGPHFENAWLPYNS